MTEAETYRSALEVIHKTVRGDEKSECWTIRKWLDDRGVFNDDIQGQKRLVEAVCVFALAGWTPKATAPAEPPSRANDSESAQWREYAQHKPMCSISIWREYGGFKTEPQPDCNCGLLALLAEPPSRAAAPQLCDFTSRDGYGCYQDRGHEDPHRGLDGLVLPQESPTPAAEGQE